MSLVRKVQASEKIHVATQKMIKFRILMEPHREHILADCKAEIQKHDGALVLV